MIEQREATILASYAALAARSKGRVYAQADHPLRTAFQRDRDRIIHSAAFRRMEYKTQVFIPHEKDHYRTRLTHTIEVAQISRTIARNLRLNEDLAEAIALVHDLGHTPFGHAGEDVLDDLLKEVGGFNHNRQSLRVVDLLEQHYADHPGLNLSYEVREGIVKHETKVTVIHPEFATDEQPTLEASIVDIADEIAYNSHDIDDGLSSGIINLDDLKQIPIFAQTDSDRYGSLRRVLDLMVTDVIGETRRRLDTHKIKSLDDVRRCSNKLCGYSTEMAPAVSEIKDFLRTNLYSTEHLVTLTEWAGEIIRLLFAAFCDDRTLMPSRYRAMLEEERVEIVAADYIAGMTDRYATEKYEQLRRR